MTEPRFDRLVALLPSLDARVGGAAGELVRIVHDDGIIPDGFDWAEWKAEGERYVERGAIDGADLETCRRLLTVIVRQDRFVEGSLDVHVRSGFAARVVRRMVPLTRDARGMVDAATDILQDEDNGDG